MKTLKSLITEARLKSVTSMNRVMLQRMAAAAQKQYDSWAQNEEGYAEELGTGGICHLIADDLAGILSENGIEAYTVSSNFEQHVYVVAKFREGVYEIDIPYSTYERGAGYNWKKLPNVVFDAGSVSISKLDSNPRNITQYIDQIEEGVKNENLTEEEDENITRLMGMVKRLEIGIRIEYPQLADFHLYLKHNGKELYLNSIKMKPNLTGQGIGTQIMEKVCNFADEHGLYITLNPQPNPGKKEKLLRFYKRFGFYPNKGRYGYSEFGGAFGVSWIRCPQKPVQKQEPVAALTEIESPYEPAKETDIKRGYIGTVYNGSVVAYDEIVPNVMQVDHSELPDGRSGTRWRYFVARPWNTILWNEFPPAPEDKKKVVEWLAKKGVNNPRDINLNDYHHIYNR